MTSDDAGKWDLYHREERWRRELESRARTSRRDLEDIHRKTKWRLEDERREASRQLDRELRAHEAQAGVAPAHRPSGVSGPSGWAGGPEGEGAGAGPRPSAAMSQLDDAVLAAAVPIAGVALLPLVAGHVATFLARGDWPAYRLVDAPGVLWRLVSHPGDPAAAYAPVNTGAPPPGPVAVWATFAVLLAVVGAVVAVVRGRLRDGGTAVQEWAGVREERALAAGRGEEDRVVVGTSGRRRLAVRDHHSLLVIGPAHAGKTSGVTVPALLEWRGPAVVASSKGHLVDETIGWRSHQGDVHVFDPAGVSPYRRSGWTPLADCGTWADSIRTAQDLTAAATAAAGVTADARDLTGAGRGELWRTSTSMALAPYLFAAAASGRTLVDVAEWIETGERDAVLAVLRNVDRAAAHAHELTFAHPDPTRAAFLQVMQRVLGVYKDPVVAVSADEHEILPAELLDGGQHTLYLTAPEHDQARFRPLSATIVRQLLAAAYERSAGHGGPLDPPLLLVLDQVVGIAPVEDLAAVASTGAARGVQVISTFQDLAQIEDHYGPATGLLIRNHRAKLVLPAGHESQGLTEPPRILPPELDADLAEGEGALLYGSTLPIRVRLRPWFRDRELRRRVATEQDTVEPAERRAPPVPVPVEQSNAWLRRRAGRIPVDPVADPTIPVDAAAFTDVFGSADEDARPDNVTPLSDARRWFHR